MQKSNYYLLAVLTWYDQVLGTSLLLGNIPPRHRNEDGRLDLDSISSGEAEHQRVNLAAASEMTKMV